LEHREVRGSGLLTGAEFEAEKRKIFGSISSHCVSEASMNPAHSCGPDLLLLNFSHYWVYIVAQNARFALEAGPE